MFCTFNHVINGVLVLRSADREKADALMAFEKEVSLYFEVLVT